MIIEFCLTCLGISQILLYSELFEKFREIVKKTPLKKLATCSMCLGFHIGWLVYFVLAIFIQEKEFNIVSMIFCGFISSFVCYFGDILLKNLERRIL